MDHQLKNKDGEKKKTIKKNEYPKKEYWAKFLGTKEEVIVPTSTKRKKEKKNSFWSLYNYWCFLIVSPLFLLVLCTIPVYGIKSYKKDDLIG